MSKPPFKQPPLRQPGQSVIQRMRARIADDIIAPLAMGIVIAFIGGMLFGLGLGTRFLPSISNPMLYVITGLGLATMVGLGIWSSRRFDAIDARKKQDLLGAEGERVVADVLDDLKRDGFRVFHDVPPEREARDGEALANFDHVVIGRTGVFVIETKTRSKADRGDKIVVTADGTVLAGGRQFERCPIRQALALRSALKTMLERQTGMGDIFVRAVALFPGWYVDRTAYRDAGGEVWTLAPAAFIKWARYPKEKTRLKPDEIALLASRIEDHVRAGR